MTTSVNIAAARGQAWRIFALAPKQLRAAGMPEEATASIAQYAEDHMGEAIGRLIDELVAQHGKAEVLADDGRTH